MTYMYISDGDDNQGIFTDTESDRNVHKSKVLKIIYVTYSS